MEPVFSGLDEEVVGGIEFLHGGGGVGGVGCAHQKAGVLEGVDGEDLEIPEGGVAVEEAEVIDIGFVGIGDGGILAAVGGDADELGDDAADFADFPVDGDVAGDGEVGIDVIAFEDGEEEDPEGGAAGAAILRGVFVAEGDFDAAIFPVRIAEFDGANGFVEGGLHVGTLALAGRRRRRIC